MRKTMVCVGVVLLLGESASWADARISFEVGGVVSYSPLDVGSVGSNPRSLTIGAASSAGSGSGVKAPQETLYGIELRPVFSLSRIARLGFGFRAAQAGASHGTTVVGGDVSVGLQHWIGPLLPFVEVQFGVNVFSTDGAGAGPPRDQLRLDGVVGTRFYFGRATYLSGAAFAGWGDQYGGMLALGADLVRFRGRGRLP